MIHLKSIMKFLKCTLRHLQKVLRLYLQRLPPVWQSGEPQMRPEFYNFTVIIFLTALQNMKASESEDKAHPKHISKYWHIARSSVPLILLV